jgi:hypothetical protein
MRKVITIIGIIIIVLAMVSIVLTSMDVLASTTIPAQNNEVNVVGNSNERILTVSDSKLMKGIYSSITVYIALKASTENQVFNIAIGIKFTSGIYPGCNDIDSEAICTVSLIENFRTTGTGSNTVPQTKITATERSLPIPLITSGLTGLSSVDREYYITINSDQSFEYTYLSVVRDRIGALVSIALLVVGIIVIVIGFIAKPSGTGKMKPLKEKSWQEPTLGGSSRNSSVKNSSRSSKSPKSSKTSSIGGGSAARVATSVNCKKCNGVMPRNSQYCPHCYTKQ